MVSTDEPLSENIPCLYSAAGLLGTEVRPKVFARVTIKRLSHSIFKLNVNKTS